MDGVRHPGRFVDVPAGVYQLGHERLEAGVPNPVRSIEMVRFQIAATPVTNREYEAFVRDTGADPPSSWGDPRFAAPYAPVVCVSWDDAMAYCAWAQCALPSEAEWECAARGLVDDRRYPWGDDEPDARHAHFAQDWDEGSPTSVGLHPAGTHPSGLQDLAGNVWEWCADPWRVDPIAELTGPVSSSHANVRPLRGGCWRSTAPKLQCSYRNWSDRGVRHITIGFRVCQRS